MYTFRCDKCYFVYESGMSVKSLETAQQLGYRDYLTCPDCGSHKATKLILDVPSVVFKGDGFTKTTSGE